MAFCIRNYPDVMLVNLDSTSLHDGNVSDLAERLLDIFQPSEARTLYLDFKNVRSLSQSVWPELLHLNAFLQENGYHLCLLNLTPSLSRELHDAKLEAVSS